jgi:pSer/pThr/pTyr-binding forkhead associated (FHA) protein
LNTSRPRYRSGNKQRRQRVPLAHARSTDPEVPWAGSSEIVRIATPPSNVVPLRGLRPVAKAPHRPEPPIDRPITSTTQVFNRKAQLRPFTEPIPLPRERSVFLHIARGPLPESLVPLHDGDVVIGRSRASALRLAHNSVSRRHAVVTRRGDKIWLTDCGSQNGTFLNGSRLRGTAVLEYGDQIHLGNAKLILRGESIVASSEDDRPSAFETPLIRALTVILALMVGMLLVIVLRSVSTPEFRPAPTVARAPEPAPPTPKVVSEPAPTAVAAPAPAVPVEPKPPKTVSKVNTEELSIPLRPATPALEIPRARQRDSRPSDSRPSHHRPHAANISDRQILKAYVLGDVDRAVGLARKAHSPLASKLEEFRLVYADARSAISVKDYEMATDNLQRASRLDAWLAKGGYFKHEIRKKLSEIDTVIGLQALNDGESEKAQQSFSRAVALDSSNERAARLLRQRPSQDGDTGDDEDRPRRHPARPSASEEDRPRHLARPDAATPTDRRALADQAFDD